MGAGETSRTALERFAADLIGLDEQANSADTLAGLFRKLRDDDYLPDPVSHEAILALLGRRINTESLLFQEASEAQERRLNQEVEQFAAGFFATPVRARIERWKALVESCSRKSRLIERLRHLKSGLTIDAVSAVDPSPMVNALIVDILTLFPMRPAQRAVETRLRVQRFLAETQARQADRSKALKQLRKRHPDLVAISQGYLDRLTESGRALRRNRLTEQNPERKSRMVAGDSGNIRSFVLITFVLVAALSRFLTADSSQRTRPSLPSSFPIVAQPSFTSPVPAPASTPNLFLRDELKQRIRQSLNQLEKFASKPQLDRVVAGLPVEIVPNVGGMANLRLLGAWTDKIQARFVKALKEGLMDADLGLTDQEVDDVVARCLPNPSPTSPSPRLKSP